MNGVTTACKLISLHRRVSAVAIASQPSLCRPPRTRQRTPSTSSALGTRAGLGAATITHLGRPIRSCPCSEAATMPEVSCVAPAAAEQIVGVNSI